MSRVLSSHQRMLQDQLREMQSYLAVLGQCIIDQFDRELLEVETDLHKHMESLESCQLDIQQSLTDPTANLLRYLIKGTYTHQMTWQVYKRVAKSDARYSLQLSIGLWGLSWITFIFLPLTFVATFFRMNVDVLSDNPSRNR